jgi:hypothetical protein
MGKNMPNPKRVKELCDRLEERGIEHGKDGLVMGWMASSHQHLAVDLRVGRSRGLVGGVACTPGDKRHGDHNFVSAVVRMVGDLRAMAVMEAMKPADSDSEAALAPPLKKRGGRGGKPRAYPSPSHGDAEGASGPGLKPMAGKNLKRGTASGRSL